MVRKTVLITGSSKGLGRALALHFSKNNYNIIIHGRNRKDLENVKEEVLKNNVDCNVIIGDVSDIKTIEELAKTAKIKDISVLVNNLGIASKGLLQDVNDKEIDEVLNVNLLSIMKLTARIYPFFVSKKSGTIININSTGGISCSEEGIIYCTSKHGLKGFTDCLRINAKKNDIKVVGVYPAGMWTTFHDRAGGRNNIETTMKPEEVAEIIFDTVKHDSVHPDELLLTRRNK